MIMKKIDQRQHCSGDVSSSCIGRFIRNNTMKILVFVFILLPVVTPMMVVSQTEFSSHFNIKRYLPASSLIQQITVEGMIKRVIGDRSKYFTVVINPSLGPSDRDAFKLVSSLSSHLTITGSSGVAAAWGFYYYLSQYAGGHVSWAGYQVNLTDPLPSVPQKGVSIASNDRYRYYMNTCTLSYSFVWFDWVAWEKQLDWMAMNAINLPLAFVGQEEIWRRVYSRLGFTSEELDSHFAGPAFLAWQRMGNMHGWGGPLPRSWFNQQVKLQHLILARMRDFGMTPVLPAFAGHVPKNITRLFPRAKVSQNGDWGGFNQTYCCTTLLDFSDPLFQQIGRNFITEYAKEFGTNHIYNCDSFNENQPPSSDPVYIQQAGRQVYQAMSSADPNAIWLMQGWLFSHNADFWTNETSHALLTSVPKGSMMVLDMPSTLMPQYQRLDSFYGQPFIWTMLHNYGGTVAMYGDIESVNKGPFNGRSMKGSSMVGIGLTMEGINQNDVMYEFMLENTWRKQSRNISAWISTYHTRRYGIFDQNVDVAWQLLKRSVYNCSDPETRHGHGRNVLVRRPRRNAQIDVWYQPEDVFSAWDHMLCSFETVQRSKLFRYDLVDVTRQSLQLIFIKRYTDVMSAYKAMDLGQLQHFGDKLLDLLNDTERILESDSHFLLGKWLENAKAKGLNQHEKQLYEYNARNQITLWGPDDKKILDYANKQWSGMVSDYYRPRWRLFVSYLMQSIKLGRPYNKQEFNMKVFENVEQPFTFSRKIYPTSARGDSIEISAQLNKKYRRETKTFSAYFSKLPEWSRERQLVSRAARRWQKNSIHFSYETD